MQKLKLHELKRKTIEEYKQSAKLELVVILDDVRSMHNIGSVFRTSDALAVKRIILCGITAKPPHREIHKTALGATQSVEWEYEKDVIVAIEKLKERNYNIIGIEQARGSIDLESFDILKSEKYALIFGNEIKGVNDEAMKRLDFCVEIKQYGTKHSFNLSVSAGIVIYKFANNLIKTTI